jgi:chorismate mutase/ribosomal protein S18 acetylase RimI-like enzyme
MKSEQCNSIEDVRENIDNIDNQIVRLIAQRGHFVKQAVKFKKNTDDVKAPDRVKSVISKILSIAKETGADPVIVEKVYQTMIQGFIDSELEIFEKSGKKSNSGGSDSEDKPDKSDNNLHSAESASATAVSDHNFQWIFSTATVDWQKLSDLYKVAPLGDKKADDLKTVFSNSKYCCFVYDDQRLAGAGRALADGLDASYICDVAVHPDYQGKGIGRDIVEKLKEFSKDYNKIILFASKGKEPFYAKLGFDRMTTAMAIFKNRQKVLESGLITDGLG